jgi:tetratricopeptide (TPR) repeat protein
VPSLTIKDKNDFATVIYGLAELESFHFSRIDSGIVYLNQLIELTPNSPLYPKALYAKAIILNEQGDYNESKAIKTQIVTNYSQTDFALALINTDSTYSKGESSSDLKLIQAEKKWSKDPIIAMDNYREIVNSDTVSETSAKAAYFLAYQYDRLWVKPDSALKYYGWILKYHSSSDQALPSSKRITFLNQVLSDTSSAQ